MSKRQSDPLSEANFMFWAFLALSIAAAFFDMDMRFYLFVAFQFQAIAMIIRTLRSRPTPSEDQKRDAP